MPRRLPRADRVPQHPDPLDLELDLVARLEPAAIAVLEDAAGSDGAGAEDVARPELGVPARLLDDATPRVVEVGEIPARALLAVHAGDHDGRRAVELVRRDDDRAEARREVLALGGAQADLHFLPLEVPRGPVVHDRET